jgi:hypothetical protein
MCSSCTVLYDLISLLFVEKKKQAVRSTLFGIGRVDKNEDIRSFLIRNRVMDGDRKGMQLIPAPAIQNTPVVLFFVSPSKRKT